MSGRASRDYDTLDFPFELKALDDAGALDGYAAVFGNVDQGGDVIEPGAFTKTIQETGGKVPILWQHDRFEPIGVSSHLEQDRKGLKVKGQLNMDVQRARETRSLLNQGAIGGLSIGYRAVKHSFEGPNRHLKELGLKEFSPVVFPMNELATASVKSAGGNFPIADRDQPWDDQAADERIRTKTGATDDPNAAYARCFFWHAAATQQNDPDSDGVPDDFGDYKLLFCDVINGEIKAVPRAIFACAEVLQGARGGVDIPPGDKHAVMERVSAYYARMASEFYDRSIRAPWDATKGALELAPFGDGDFGAALAYLNELKEGRMISSANLETLKNIRDSHRAAADQLDALLCLAEPPDGTPDDGAAKHAETPAYLATLRDSIKSLTPARED